LINLHRDNFGLFRLLTCISDKPGIAHTIKINYTNSAVGGQTIQLSGVAEEHITAYSDDSDLDKLAWARLKTTPEALFTSAFPQYF